MNSKFEDNIYDGEVKKLIRLLHDAQNNSNKELEKEILFQLSQLHYENSNYIQARTLLKKILVMDKKQANVYYYLGLIELEDNNYDLALKNFKKELEINPKNHLAKKIINKIEVKNNFPLITIVLFFLNTFFFFFYSYPEIDLITSITYGLNYISFNFFNLITALFFHINLLHYILNMVMLLLFGFILEKEIGSFKFFLVYFISGMTGIFFEVLFTPDIIVMGASASIFGILGALMLLEPFLKIKIFGIFNVPIILVLGSIFTVSIFLSSIIEVGVSQGNISHLLGFLSGVFIIGIMNHEKIGVFYNWIFIFFGFWFVKMGIDKIYLNEYLGFVFLSILGIILIGYSYMTLKNSSEHLVV